MTGWTRCAAAIATVLLFAGCGSAGDQGAAEDDLTTSTLKATTSTTEATTTTPTVATTTVLRGGPTPWQSLIAGDCIDPLPEGIFTEVTVVDCDAPHAAEAISGLRAVSNVGGGDFDQAAQAQCEEELAPMGGSGYAATYILEVQGTILARAVCLVVDPTGAPHRGSLVASHNG